MRVPMIQVYSSDINPISYSHNKELDNTIADRSDYEKDMLVYFYEKDTINLMREIER